MNHCFGLWIIGVLANASAGTPNGSMIEEWGKWGLAGVIILYTLWRDWDREKRMSTDLNARDAWSKTEMQTALTKNTEALVKHEAAVTTQVAASDRQTRVMERLTSAVDGCPRKEHGNG